MKMKAFYLTGFMILFLSGCCQTNRQDLKNEIMQIDRAFNDMAQTEGVAVAFEHYSADSVILFRNAITPIVGKGDLIVSFVNFPPEASLIWKPYFADMAASGDLGYTLGSYVLTVVDSVGSEKSAEGNYVTIWKKQPNGDWKFVFDAGNEGPRPEL
jgi:ketosteroid isomerase-like protein